MWKNTVSLTFFLYEELISFDVQEMSAEALGCFSHSKTVIMLLGRH